MSDALFTRAELLGGVFGWADARATGVRPRELAALVRRGLVDRVGPRAYVLRVAFDATASVEEQHRLRTLALVRSFEGRAAASHQSAAAVYGLPFWNVDAATVHLCRVHDKATRRRPGLVVHEAVAPEAVIRSDATGMHCVNAALAVIGTAIENGEDAGTVAADHALHRGLTTMDELASWLTAMRRHPGVVAAKRSVARAEPLSESVGETRTRLILRAMPGLPSVLPQVPFHDDSGHEWARGDFGVGEHLVVEFDGAAEVSRRERRDLP